MPSLAGDSPTLIRDHIRRLLRLGQISRTPRRGRAAPTLGEQVVPNVLARQFDVVAPDTWWLGDITTITTDEGDLHLAGVLDLGGRELVGWATAAIIPTELALTAIQAALQRRGQGPCGGSPHGSGRRGTSHAYQAVVATVGVSMSRAGCCLDNFNT